MEFRLHGLSLRLRSTCSEVAELTETGQVEEASKLDRLPPSAWFTACGFFLAHEEMIAKFVERKIMVGLPSEGRQRWASREEVGVYTERPWCLRLMIEKTANFSTPVRTRMTEMRSSSPPLMPGLVGVSMPDHMEKLNQALLQP